MIFLSKMKFTWRLVGLTALPFVAFLVVSVWGVLLPKYEDKSIAELMEANIILAGATSDVVNELQKERGMSALFLNKGLDKNAVDAQRLQSNTTLAPFRKALENGRIGQDSKRKALEELDAVQGLRRDVDGGLPVKENIRRYSQIISKLVDLDSDIANAPTTKGIGKVLTTLNLLEAAKENAGKLRATMSSLLAANRPLSTDDLQMIVGLKATVDVNLSSPALVLSREIKDKLDQFRKSDAWKEVDRVYVLMVGKASEGEFGVDGAGFFRTISTQIENIGSLVKDETSWTMKRADEISSQATAGMTASTAMVLVISALLLALGYGVIRSITGPLKRVIDGLNTAASEVSAASNETSAASNSLADGSSEQAAAIEETSSSLEEMSSMTKQNASNAGQADSLMKQTNLVVSKANTSMKQLTTSMQEITKASEDTSKIIKTIDEIAFQTNLLALNAAVEAARAGEAGAGFAVVADEVRNLAMRSAEAAKNTATLIEGTVKKVTDGSALVKATGDAFKEVAANAAKVGELVGEIAAASSEQAQGIEQVNLAVTEMDKVTQQNAANAEESASASEELNAQAEELKAFVQELAVMVGGNAAVSNNSPQTAGRPKAAGNAGQTPKKALSAAKKPAKGKALSLHRSREVNPDDIIPMDESDFKDF